MAEWLQHLLRLMKPGISAFAVESLLCRHPGERQRGSVLTVAEISGGTAISTRCREKQIMTSYARCARSPLQSMEMQTGSIAPMSATSRIGLGVADDESGRRKA